MRNILCFSISTKRKTKITYLEHQKNIVNASGWNEYLISITNPNEEDIHKTIYLEGTRYNWNAFHIVAQLIQKLDGVVGYILIHNEFHASASNSKTSSPLTTPEAYSIAASMSALFKSG